MKKRAVEALAVLAALIALFAAVNFIAKSVSENTVKIDGDFYNTGISELSLTLMTEDGLDNLAKLPRLTSLKITPFKEAAANAAVGNSIADNNAADTLTIGNAADPAAKDAIGKAAILSEYENCTELTDLSVLSNLTQLEKLDVSYCHINNLDFISQMQELVSLNIGCTEITNLSPLTDFPKLERLIIYGTPADDLSPLLQMNSLKTLIISNETAEKFPDEIAALEEKGIEIEKRE